MKRTALDAHAIFRVGGFLVDALATAVAAWLIACASGHVRRGIIEPILAWGLAFIGLVAGAGVVLGETGGFGPRGFLIFHGVVLALLVAARWRVRESDMTATRQWLAALRGVCEERGPARWLAAALLFVLMGLVALAAAAEPAIFDALTYRLPRMAHWLQDGRIQILATEDARLNFVAGLSEIVGAWLLGASREGFSLVALTQAAGGVLAFGATCGLARASGLSRTGALLAGALLLGMANVVAQFSSVQTDLFTAGLFAAGFHLWFVAWRRGEVSVVGLGGVGLALGAKGTIFYLGPGAVVWVAYLTWKYRGTARQWIASIIIGAAAVIVFAGPGFWRNWRAYGDPLGPALWVKKHHAGFASTADLGRKLGWNLGASLAQNFDPHSQPAPLRELARETGRALAARLPERDPYTLDGLNRRGTLHGLVLARTTPDADLVAFGGVTLVLFVVGGALALGRMRRPDAQVVAAWTIGVGVFGLFFHAMHQWHPFAFRYLVLAAPWIAIVSAWGIEQLMPRWRVVMWSILLVATVDVAMHVVLRTHQSGWRAVAEPERSRGAFVTRGWREWSKELEGPLALALPEERPIAGFYRQVPPRRVDYVPQAGAGVATAEALVRGVPGWVIVPAGRFLGAEGRVAARTWLFEGREDSAFSVAAYRTLRPSEMPAPVLYRQRRERRGAEVSYSLLLKTWTAAPVTLAVRNPDALPWEFVAVSPTGRFAGVAAPGVVTTVAIPMAAEMVAEMQITFRSGGAADAGAGPRVDLATP